MDARCKNCISWQFHEDDWGKRWRECSAAWGGDLRLLSGEEFEVFADASDDTGLRSAFITGPEFGCVKFKAFKEVR
jgi:hypothetical protein